MKIALYNLEGKIKNLALEKLRLYHRLGGDEVEDYLALWTDYDRIYCSSIFDYTKKDKVPPNAICGGTGFDLTTTLSPEVEAIKPKLNYGFTTRGCIRRCPFCVVPQKEGNIRVVGDLLDLWDGQARDIVLYDNNILALPEHLSTICEQANTINVRLDFNGGLDHRLLTQDIIDLLKSIKHIEYRFAFDDIRMMPSVDSAISLLQRNGINRCNWYVLCGFNSTFAEDLERLNFLKDRNQVAFVMRYRDKNNRPADYLTPLARWANQHHIFRGMSWEQFIAHKTNKRYWGMELNI